MLLIACRHRCCRTVRDVGVDLAASGTHIQQVLHMHGSKQSRHHGRSNNAAFMLVVFVAYLVYLPIHAISGEHCLPGIGHAQPDCINISEQECISSTCDFERGGTNGHDQPEDTSDHQHHSAEDHEVESTAKIGSQELVSSVSTHLSFQFLQPREIRFASRVDGRDNLA